jgi:hypothetical protein
LNVTAIAKELDAKMKLWRSSTAKRVEAQVSDIIALADRNEFSAKPTHKPSATNGDVFLTDKRVYRGRTPKDLSANHDRYLYGEQ